MIYAHLNRCGYLYDISYRVASIGKDSINLLAIYLPYIL